ncbi:PQQ-dependent sugar dehydrogenase [Flavobacterium sp. RSB2_4_14]|uniref:PQQ-dependent sugar dehydrogenase n=1 Tax=Flavobacterium sp. RSB2_4_14 TaxID=3447665 RepID=UPI003F41507B
MKKILLFSFCLLSLLSFGQSINLQSFATGFSSPVEMAQPANDPRIFVVQKGGLIRIVNANGTINATPFLTVTGISTGSEQGLLGLAFHPNYATNGLFFINYTNTAGNTVIAKYSVSANPDIANATGTILMTINQPQANHNGGTIKFGPDGFLYIGMGDGGGAGDTSNYAQNLSLTNGNLVGNPSRIYLGKMLRIDVNTTVGALNYGYPSTNPYVSEAGKEEIWAIGLRNPWKFSFNRLNGDMWIADVGQNAIEEINKIANPLPNTGLNFGWRCYEGNTDFNTSGTCPVYSATVAPLAQYTHASNRCSITGGYFYTGTTYPNLQNKYVFADYCTGEIGYINDSNQIVWSFDSPGTIATFGEGSNGELYAFVGNALFKVIDTSLNALSFEEKTISIYPNPANNELYIKNENNVGLKFITIADLTGKIVLNQNIQRMSSNAINISNLAKGMYLVTLETQNGLTATSKIIKQ